MASDATPMWAREPCSLPSSEQPARVAEFDQLFADSVLWWTRVSATRLDVLLPLAAEAAARDLADREVGCCSFFTFDFAGAGADLVMSISVPPTRVEVLDALADRVGTALAGRAKS